MKTSTSSDRFIATFGLFDGIDRLGRVGYDALDLSFFATPAPLYEENWRDACKRLREIMQKNGIAFNQAHTDFPTWHPDGEEKNAARRQRLIHELAVCAELGIPHAIVHPGNFPYQNDGSHVEQNIDFYRSLLPYAKEYGVKIAVENMYRHNKAGNAILPYTCADPREFVRVMDALDPDWFIACLDIGHVLLTGYELGYAIRALGHERLHALHVHDVDYLHDLHTLPYQSKVDWEEVIAALRDVRYDGDLTLEADNFLLRVPPALCEDAARFMAKTAAYLRDRIVE